MASPCYITTAINYTNGPPHIGHAYEAVTADIIARYQRLFGKNVFFRTGTDEHGQKIAQTAMKQGITPAELCDKYAHEFQRLNNRLLISNNDFIRTSVTPQHCETAQRLWQQCADAGDIYLGTYNGWYNEREETFVTETEAEANQFQDPATGLPLKRMSEESYFFRMSKYLEPLLAHYEAHPDFVQPDTYRNSILSRLRTDGLHDLSISRTSFSWGIPVPEGFKEGHVMYVWFDALVNYLTGMEGTHYWPASYHIIGKDIIWFHGVIWPCMLLSAGLPLPQHIFAHGFVNDAEGKKMSKSIGNVVEPHAVLDQVPVDSFRYYLCQETTYGSDLNFNLDNLKQIHNTELADVLGNLVNRVLNLSKKYCGGRVQDVTCETLSPPPFDLASVMETAQSTPATSIHLHASHAMQIVRDMNKWLADLAPWKSSDLNYRQHVTQLALQGLYVAAHFLLPVIPHSAMLIFEKLGTPPKDSITSLSLVFDNLPLGTQTCVGDILFVKF